MTFVIRHVSQTADGRDIARDTVLEADGVTIGRAPDNAITLPDLGVSPHHARIEQLDDQRITVAATGTLGFAVDGRRRTRSTIDSAKGAEIAIGGHRITVTRDANGRVILAVARVAALSEAAEAREEADAFSLKGLLPGKRRSAWVLAIVVLVAFLAVPVWSYVQQHRANTRSIYAAGDHSWSSGPLSTAHHALEGKCESCHVKAFVAVRDSACVACHTDVHDHAPAARMASARATPGLGGRLLQSIATSFGKPGPGSCVDCHSEHEGAGAMAPTAQAFCTDCHGTLASRVTDTKLGNAGDFATSHPQFRPLVATAPGAKPTMARVSLDAKPIDDSGLKFAHKLHLDPRSGVSRMAQTLKGQLGYGDVLTCADCHTPTADGTRFLPVSMEKTCQGCHSLGLERVGGTVRTLRHGDTAQVIADLRTLYRWSGSPRPVASGAMTRQRPGEPASQGGMGVGSVGGDPVRAVFSKGGACYDCHTIIPPGVGGAREWTVTPVNQPMRYLLHGWFDHAAHSTETCTSCHAAAQSSSATDLLLPGIATCRTCHGGEGATRSNVPSGCAMCHSYHIAPGSPWRSRQSLRSQSFQPRGGGRNG